MTTSTTTKSDKLTLEVNELLAYHLYRMNSFKANQVDGEEPPFETALVTTWRCSVATRDEYRQSAAVFTTMLQEAGISLKVTSSKDVLAAIKDLLTIPASQAYTLS